MTSPEQGPSPTGTEGPLISVVLPTWNSAAVIARALQSLADQTWRAFEVVVSDGASGDDTVSIAQRFRDALPALRIDSRPDGGVYDAINLGVAQARGRWCLVLGSDDRIHAAETFARIAPALHDPGAEIVYGDVLMAPREAGTVSPGHRHAGPTPLPRLIKMNVCQQSIFYRRELLARLGGFNPRYRLYADWDLNLRAAFVAPMRWIDLIVADYASTGMSSAAQDMIYLAEQPDLVRAALLRHRDDPATRPAQYHLLRFANRCRRQGEWRRAGGFIADWLRLMSNRIRPAPHSRESV